jgi:ATP-binding cassette subfamily B protein
MIGLLSFSVVIGFLVLNLWVVKVYVRPANLKSNALDSRIGGALADAITSNPTVKTFGAESREESRFAQVTGGWSRAVQITWGRFMDVWVMQNVLMVVLQAGMTGMLLNLWVQGAASPGDIAFAITTFMLMSGYLRNIGENVRMMQKGLDDVEDVANYARMVPQVADAPAARPFVGGEGEIVFDRVSFRYKSAGEPLYDGFSLRIAPGERVALVGPTGAGKSTFVKLIQRLYDLQGGSIAIDGQDNWRRSGRGPTTSSRRCRRATTPWSASGASSCRAASASAWPSPGPSWPTHPSWSSTRRPARWTSRPKSTSRRRWRS